MAERHRTVAGRLRHVSGWRPSPPDHRDRKLSAPGWLARLKLPSAAGVVEDQFKVEDQANLGSCTCNSGSSMLEYVIWKQTGGRLNPQLSRLWLYAMVRKFEGVPLTEDPGAYNRDVMKVLAKFGCPDEDLYPYDLSKWSADPEAVGAIEKAKLDASASLHKAAYYYSVPNLWALKASLAQGFPVLFGFSVPSSMFSDETSATGVVSSPKPGETYDGGHAVLAVGYSDTTKRVKFLNSWSTGWGAGGLGFLPYDYFTLGLADDMWSLRTVELST